MRYDANVLKVELLAAAKDSEIAELRQRLLIELLRQVTGASLDDTFDPSTCGFIKTPTEVEQ